MKQAERGSYFPLDNLLGDRGRFVHNARLFLILGDKCVRISWGDYGHGGDLSRLEIMPAVQDVLGEEYVYERTSRWGTIVVNLREEDQILVVSECQYMWEIKKRGHLAPDLTAPTEIVRSRACGIWKKSEGYKPL